MSTIRDPYDLNDIWFAEDLKSQEFSFTGNSFSARRSFWTKWENRFGLTRAFMGTSKIDGKLSSFPEVKRVPGEGFHHLFEIRPTQISHPFLYPVGVDRIEPAGPNRKAPGKSRYKDNDLFSRAKVTFSYDATTYRVLTDEDTPSATFRYKVAPLTPTLVTSLGQTYSARSEIRRYVTRITQPITENLRLPIGAHQYAEGFEDRGEVTAKPNIRVDIGTYIINPSMEVTYVWHMVPALVQTWEKGDDWLYVDQGPNQAGVKAEMVGAAYTHLGCVNARWFDGFPPGTLMLMAVEAHPYRWLDGQRFYDYTYRMKFFNPKDQISSTAFPVVQGPGDQRIMSRDPTVPHSYVGHNYFMRLKGVAKGMDGKTIVAEPFFALVTHDGTTLEQGGRPVFQYRDFEDLFIPYNRAHMVQYYKNVTLTPIWQGDEGT